jgi:adenylate cyclase
MMQGRFLGLLLLLGLVAIRAWDLPVAERLRFLQFDQMQQIWPREMAQSPVVIVDLDEDSLRRVGQWPWPRHLIAQLVDRLSQSGAAVITFDMVFPEPDRMSPAEFAKATQDLSANTRAELAGRPSNDFILSRAIGRSRVVLGLAPLDASRREVYTPHITPPAEIGGDPRPFLPPYLSGIIGNVPMLDAAAQGRGAFYLLPESDGIVRRVPAISRVGDEIVPALFVEALRVATGQPNYGIKSDSQGLQGIIVAGVLVPTGRDGTLWIRYGMQQRDRRVAAADVLDGKVDPQRFAGKLVLIGTSAAGLGDIVLSPHGSTPGVEVWAQVLESAISGTVLIRTPEVIGAEYLGIIAAGLLLIVLVPILGARWTILLLVGCIAIFAGGSIYVFLHHNLLFDAVYPSLSALLCYSLLVYVGHYTVEKRRRQVSDAFSLYLSPVMVQRVAKEPDRLKLGGELKHMTIMFCDIRGFTGISERLQETPEALTRLVNRFLTPLSDEVQKNQGTIDKYIGDCIMAFWNAPLEDAAHAAHACQAALDMFRALAALNVELEAEAKQGDHTQEIVRAFRALKQLALKPDADDDDRQEFIGILQREANLGSAAAQYALAKAYRDGLIGARDQARAVQLFNAAAEAGYTFAQRNIGERYARGDGLPHDRVMALTWLSLAARDGLAAAEESRIELIRHMSAEEINQSERKVQAWRPSRGRAVISHLAMGIGVNTGSCVVGNMGSRSRLNYSVLGDAVNLAARLESQSANYGVPIVISAATQQEAPGFASLELDRVIVKGKSEPVAIFGLLGDPAMGQSASFKELQNAHAAMLGAYRARRWREALERLGTCAGLAAHLESLYDLYRERIENYLENPPPIDWDGVFVALKK